jgi:putative FmdB family regulatory protein
VALVTNCPQKGRTRRPSYTRGVATYEYRCPTCESHYELRRPMSESSSAATCPDGHPGGVRLLSVFASVSSGPTPGPSPAAGGGMSCGPACACH